MALRFHNPLYQVILATAFFLIAGTANAQSLGAPVYAGNSRRVPVADSLIVISSIDNLKASFASPRGDKPENIVSNNVAEQKRLTGYLKAFNISEEQQQARPNKKFYYHLANVFARLRLYPLAMKCFLKAAPLNNDPIVNETLITDTMEMDTAALTVNIKDDKIVADKIETAKTSAGNAKSEVTSYYNILSNFNDGKPAAAYALLFHVKQPVSGKRKIFVWGNVGHTFITLIKYNKDSTYISASFGFYPQKDQPLSATPIFPTTSSTFKDDAEHQWDEVVGKFISKRKFEKILKLTKAFNGVKYNLNNRNCTDFGLQAADLAGINIKDTSGKWPLGRGNNPAVTGQSLLMGKVSNADFRANNELFKANLVER